ncbi:MAG TPA: CopG family transcriptional regulator [Thermoanaerobaculia bacterium]|nr:CopG family transcriptional regulator [Thermoanaerobaculia bacterium]
MVIMTRTIQLPDELVERVERSADDRGVSLDELIRETLEARFPYPDSAYEEDPFLSDREVYTGPTPPDLIENLDEYLYGRDD